MPLSLSNESKQPSRTWANALYEWADALFPWSNPPFFVIKKESKNSLGISNESKNTGSETFDADSLRTFDQEGTFGSPGIAIYNEQKT